MEGIQIASCRQTARSKVCASGMHRKTQVWSGRVSDNWAVRDWEAWRHSGLAVARATEWHDVNPNCSSHSLQHPQKASSNSSSSAPLALAFALAAPLSPCDPSCGSLVAWPTVPSLRPSLVPCSPPHFQQAIVVATRLTLTRPLLPAPRHVPHRPFSTNNPQPSPNASACLPSL